MEYRLSIISLIIFLFISGCKKEAFCPTKREVGPIYLSDEAKTFNPYEGITKLIFVDNGLEIPFTLEKKVTGNHRRFLGNFDCLGKSGREDVYLDEEIIDYHFKNEFGDSLFFAIELYPKIGWDFLDENPKFYETLLCEVWSGRQLIRGNKFITRRNRATAPIVEKLEEPLQIGGKTFYDVYEIHQFLSFTKEQGIVAIKTWNSTMVFERME